MAFWTPDISHFRELGGLSYLKEPTEKRLRSPGWGSSVGGRQRRLLSKSAEEVLSTVVTVRQSAVATRAQQANPAPCARECECECQSSKDRWTARLESDVPHASHPSCGQVATATAQVPRLRPSRFTEEGHPAALADSSSVG